MTESRQHIPYALARAIQTENYDEVVRVVDEAFGEIPENVCEALWRAAQERPAIARVLAYFLVRRSLGVVADASRLWLLVAPTADAMTIVNVLSGLSVLAVERDGVPEFYASALADFLRRALEQRGHAVRISVLDFLRDYCDAEGPPRLLGQGLARQVADDLDAALKSVVEEEEVGELAEVLDMLRSTAIPEMPPVDLAGLQSLVDKLERRAADERLLAFVRGQNLRGSGRWQARHLHRPVITIRIVDHDERMLAHLSRIADLCRMQQGDAAGDWIDAPPASITKHLKASEETSRATLERFQRAVSVAAKGGDPATLSEFPPRQAQALATMLIDSIQKGARAELIFTEPDPVLPQLTLEFQTADDQSKKWIRVLEEVRERGDLEPEIYSEEVPQANTVAQVFQAVDALLKKGSVEVKDIDNLSSTRQVNYYKQGARILGFLDVDNEPTPLAKELRSKGDDARMSVAARAFNDSMVGRAWRAWAQEGHLVDVDSSTAEKFLKQRAIGISGSTIPRRAQTLRKWFAELKPFFRP